VKEWLLEVGQIGDQGYGFSFGPQPHTLILCPPGRPWLSGRPAEAPPLQVTIATPPRRASETVQLVERLLTLVEEYERPRIAVGWRPQLGSDPPRPGTSTPLMKGRG
jgi:hypothetical protein